MSQLEQIESGERDSSGARNIEIAKSEARKVWERPLLRSVSAHLAEIQFNGGDDTVVQS